jgi:hypothetical protein
MTTMTSHKGRMPWLMIVAIVAVLLIVLPAINGHAVRSHGDNARSAYCWLLACDDTDPDDADRLWHGTQDDGREVYVYRLPRLPGKPVTWAIAVVGAGFLVTCFLSQNRRSVDNIKERCD